MAELTERTAGRARRMDAAALAGGAFFVIAILAAAYPTLRAGPATAGGLMLLIGLAGVAVLGLFAFRQAPAAEAASDLALLLEALASAERQANEFGRDVAARLAALVLSVIVQGV